MANNYTDASIQPPLPASLFSQAEIESLAAACNVVCDHDGDDLHLFGETFFSTEGEDEERREVNLLTLLQGKLRQLDPAAYPHITIHGAATCDKKRPDEFGGFAYVITRDQIHSISTWEFATQTAETACHDGGRPWNAIETKTIAQDGQTYRIRIYPDPDAPNPLEDWRNGHDTEPEPPAHQLRPGRRRGSDRGNPDAVPLSYYEHGLCLWQWPASCPPPAAARGIRSHSPGSGCPMPRRWNPPGIMAVEPASFSCGSAPARRATPIRSGATARSMATRSSR